MFIVKNKIKGKDYYYLRKSVRENGKVISKCVAYLGKNKKDAEKKAAEIMKGLNNPINKPKEMEEKKEIEKKELKLGSKIDEITGIASKRGFFFQTANIYGGKAGFFTYGHLGKLLKTNWEKLWKDYFLGLNDNFYEIQSNSILPEPVFKASGHIENFNDPMTECKKCHFRFRADQFLEDKNLYKEVMNIKEMQKVVDEHKLKCPKCGGELSEIKQFNMMFPVNVGFNEEKAYLSPETAQGAYLAFKEEFQATRSKLPLGLAIIDKAYRNEISPRQMFFRLREFSQAELQIFFDSDKVDFIEEDKWKQVEKYKLRIKKSKDDETKEVSVKEARDKLGIPKFYAYHMAKVQQFYLNVIKIPAEKFRLRELGKEERAFYNKIHFDVEVDLDTIGGFKEIGGIHYRTDHDLAGHSKVSGQNLEVFFDNKKILPHVLELSFGVDRNIWTLLDIFYNINDEGSMLKFPGNIAPIKAAVFPIIKTREYNKMAEDIINDLKKEFNVVYDQSGSIGRRYARNDEIGTPYCITIDEQSLKDKTATIRDRDTTKQIRVKISELREILKKLINSEIEFEKAGKIVETRKK